MKILVLNGPNLNLLGEREPDVYGSESYESLVGRVSRHARDRGAETDFRQFNAEGDIIGCLHEARGAYEGAILNPGAYTHYSYAIHDAVKAVGIPTIEVHLSNVFAREAFRSASVVAPACVGQIAGLGIEGYLLAVDYFLLKRGGGEWAR